MLIKTIRLHPEIFSFGEMFSDIFAGRRSSMRMVHAPINVHENHMEFLEKVGNSLPVDRGLKYFTFKLHYTHAKRQRAWNTFHQDLINNNTPIVILERKNSLKQVLSLYLAALNFAWSAKEYQQKLHANPDVIIGQIRRYKRWNQEYHETFKNYKNKVELIYEDIVENQ